MCLAQGHNAVTSVRLEPTAPLSRDEHSTTEPLHSVTGMEFTKHLSEQQTGNTLIRSDLGMHCLSRPFCQATSVRHLRTSTIISEWAQLG